MARPTKQGIDYFPLDIDYHTDPKFVRLRAELGVLGEMCALRLLSTIYRNGYYIEHSENLLYMLADNLRLDFKFVDDVVNGMLKCGLLDELLYTQTGILSSRGIQKRWINAVVRRKNLDTSKYWLLDNVDINGVNDDIMYTQTELMQQNANHNEQIKSNQSKVNQSNDEIDYLDDKQEEGGELPNVDFRKKAEELFFKSFCDDGEVINDDCYPAFLKLFQIFKADIIYKAVMQTCKYMPKNPVEYVKTCCSQIRAEGST